MTKNNMWRDNIEEMKTKFASSDLVQINWINGDRIPSPGTWFTNSKFALGGVEKDLLPHLMSLFVAVGYTFSLYAMEYHTLLTFVLVAWMTPVCIYMSIKYYLNKNSV